MSDAGSRDDRHHDRRGEREGTGRIRHGGQARRSDPGRRSAQRPSERGRHGDPARRLAYDTLRAVSDGAYANLDLPRRLRAARLDARDAAFATELVYGVTRLRGRYDAIIARCAGRPLERIDPPVLDVLRLGAHQLLGMRVPPHAAVDATVGLARSTVGAGAASFTNAVLRRISEKPLVEWLAIVAPTAPLPTDAATRDAPPSEAAALPGAPPGHGDTETSTTATGVADAGAAAGRPGHPAPDEPASSDRSGRSGEAPRDRSETAAAHVPLDLDDVAVAYSHPVWIVRALRQALLADGASTPESVDADLLALLEADNTPADVTLVARPGLAELDELVDAGARPGTLSPVAAILESGGDPGRIPAVRDGRAAVQDEGSQLLVLALVAAYDAARSASTPDAGGPRRRAAGESSPGERSPDGSASRGSAAAAPLSAESTPESSDSAASASETSESRTAPPATRAAETPHGTTATEATHAVETPPVTAASDAPDATGSPRWLDLCAGPGGKAALLASLAIPRGATLFCNEISEHRADLVESAVGAAMDDGAEVFVGVGDGRTIGAEEPGSFDLVLLDAPCTGLGALRRRPDARWRRTPADVADLIALQEELLDSGLDALRPGGVLGYATCSPHVAETRQVIERVLRSRDDIEVLDANACLSRVVTDPAQLNGRGPGDRFAQLWPHVHATDAMFFAVLQRSSDRTG